MTDMLTETEMEMLLDPLITDLEPAKTEAKENDGKERDQMAVC